LGILVAGKPCSMIHFRAVSCPFPMNPDKWATMIKTIANLGGYNDKLLIENNINIDIQLKGDAELIEHLQTLTGKLKALGFDDEKTEVTEAVYEEVSTD